MSYAPIVKMDNRLDRLISPDARLEAVVTGFGFTEGVTWINAGPDSHLLFSDIPANVVYRWHPTRGVEIHLERTGYQGCDVWRVGMPFTNGKAPDDPAFEQFNMFGSNGLTLDQEGRLVIATWGGRSIVRVEQDGQRSVLAEKYEGKRFGGPNDVVVRKDGSIYFTDTFGGMAKLGDDPRCEIDLNAIYMIRNGSVVRIIGDIPNTNGLAFSPDEKVLYANGSIDNYIRRYDVLADGTVANGRMFADLRDETGIGITDGMRVDETGNLWSTGPGGVWIISPEGTRLGRIPLPEGGTNLVFGGADRKTVFVSCPTTIYRIDTIVAGAR